MPHASSLRIVALAALGSSLPQSAYGWEPTVAGLTARQTRLAQRRIEPPDNEPAEDWAAQRPLWLDRSSWFLGQGEHRVAWAVGVASGPAKKTELLTRANETAIALLGQLLTADVERRLLAATSTTAASDTIDDQSHRLAQIVDWYYDAAQDSVATLAALECAAQTVTTSPRPCDEKVTRRRIWQAVIRGHPVAPTWAGKTAWFEGEGDERAAYAVGRRTGINSQALMMTAAQNAARARMTGLIYGYQRESTAGGSVVSTSGLLHGVHIVDYYYDLETNTLYALSRVSCGDLARPEAAAACRDSSGN